MLPNSSERPVVSAEEAFAHLGIDRTTGYRAIREGRFPVEVIRIGRVIRVPTNALRRLLDIGVGVGADEDTAEDGSADDSSGLGDLSAGGGTLARPSGSDRRHARDPVPQFDHLPPRG